MSFSASPRAVSAIRRVRSAFASASCARFMLTKPKIALPRATTASTAQTAAILRARPRLARGAHALAVRLELPLGLIARRALEPQIAARLDDAAEHVVRELDPAQVEALLDAQQPPVDERGERFGRR